jgi:hypothetical protein
VYQSLIMKAAAQLAIILALLFTSSSASAAVITQCGSSSGETFYFEGGVIGADKAGWHKDVVPGSFELVANGPPNYSEADTIYENPAPIGPSSYRAEGAKVWVPYRAASTCQRCPSRAPLWG